MFSCFLCFENEVKIVDNIEFLALVFVKIFLNIRKKNNDLNLILIYLKNIRKKNEYWFKF